MDYIQEELMRQREALARVLLGGGFSRSGAGGEGAAALRTAEASEADTRRRTHPRPPWRRFRRRPFQGEDRETDQRRAGLSPPGVGVRRSLESQRPEAGRRQQGRQRAPERQ